MVNLYSDLSKDFKEVSAMEFYRDIFPIGELDKKDEFTKGKYTGIACEFCNELKSDGKQLVKRYSITDELSVIEELLHSENFVIISPISYFGKSRKTDNARIMYALGIELDGLRKYEDGRQIGYEELKYQFSKGSLPTPNYLVASGNGIHLYYIFDKPLVLFDNVKKSLMKFKREITRNLWNRYTTVFYEEEKVQYESAFQGFRLVGGITKAGDRTCAFKVKDEPTTIEYLNSFVLYDSKIECVYKNDLRLAEAKEKFPEWYQRVVVEKQPKGHWIAKRALYDWWLREIKKKRSLGHRYYCMMILCIYAIKCDISREELEKDCYSLLDLFDSDSIEESNRFTVKDIADALQSFDDKTLITYPIDTIVSRTGIEIKKNKRNFRSQELHLQIARATRDIIHDNWREGNGRPQGSGTKEQLIKDFLEQNKEQNLSITEIARRLGVSRPTIYKYLAK